MLVPYTSDPAKKLADAVQLNDQQNRPLPAERLIREAMDTYKNEGNQDGLAESYRVYGFFFRSPTVSNWEKYYKTHGFHDKSVTWDTRYQKSIEYFTLASNIYKSENRYDMLSNVHFNMGITYLDMGNKNDACDSFNKSIGDNKIYMKNHPNIKIGLPSGVSSYEQYVDNEKSIAKCQ